MSATRDLQLYVRKDSLSEERGEWRGGRGGVGGKGGSGEVGGEGAAVRAVLISVIHRPTHCLFLIAFHKVLNLSA